MAPRPISGAAFRFPNRGRQEPSVTPLFRGEYPPSLVAAEGYSVKHGVWVKFLTMADMRSSVEVGLEDSLP